MKKILFASAAAMVAAAATPAMAADAALQVTLAAKLEKACTINSSTSDAVFALSNSSRNANGKLAYACNYVGVPVVTAVSTNGALTTTELGAVPVIYTLWLGDATPGTDGSSWVSSAALAGKGTASTTAGAGGWTRTTVPNQTVNTNLAFYLKDTIAVAGNYSDTVAITIAP